MFSLYMWAGFLVVSAGIWLYNKFLRSENARLKTENDTVNFTLRQQRKIKDNLTQVSEELKKKHEQEDLSKRNQFDDHDF